MFLPSNITLSPGDSGDFVRELQRRLSSLNLYPAEALSGFYDGMTSSAVTSFQFQQGLRSDGIAGPETLRRLNGVLSGTADSTPAQTQPSTEDVMKTFYAVDHLVQQDSVSSAQHQHDAFTFQPHPPTEQPAQQTPHIQPAAQAFTPPPPIQSVQPNAPAIDPFAAAVAQQAFVPPPPTQPIPPEHSQPQPQQLKPIDAMLQPVQPPQAVTEKLPLQSTPQPQPELHPQPVKPIDAMLQQPQPQPQPIAEKPPLQPAPQLQPELQQPQPVKPIEQKPIEQVFTPPPPGAQPRPIEQQLQRADEQRAQPMPEQKPAPVQQATQETEAAPERQSLRQRFSGMMQRIADYMESKLPQSVQAEVQKIGMQMAERGVRENPIPQNETALPSPSATPGRGQQQVER